MYNLNQCFVMYTRNVECVCVTIDNQLYVIIQMILVRKHNSLGFILQLCMGTRGYDRHPISQ